MNIKKETAPMFRLPAKDAISLLWFWTAIGLAAFINIFRSLYFITANGHDRAGFIIGRDFVNMWVGAKLLLQGKVADIFLHTKYYNDMHSILSFSNSLKFNFSYPPTLLPLIFVFGLFSYFISLALWYVLGTVMLAAILKFNSFCKLHWLQICLVLLSPAAIINLLSGQNGAFTAAFFLGGLYLSESSPRAAGILLGLLTVKPHLGILVPPVLLFCRRWKCFSVATIVALFLIGLSCALWGTGPWKDFFQDTLSYQQSLLFKFGNYHMRPDPCSRICVITNPLAAIMSYAGIAVFTLVLLFNVVRKEGISPRSVLMLAIATIIILPYSFNYDMVAITGAIVVYLATLEGIGLLAHSILGMLWAMPLLLMHVYPIEHNYLWVILLAAIFCLYKQKLQELPIYKTNAAHE